MNRVIFTALLLSLFNSSSSALVLYINSFHFEVDNVVLGSQNVEGFIDIPNSSQELTNYQLSFDDLIMIFDSTQNFTIDTYDDIDSEMEPTIVETEYAYTNFDYPTFTLTNSKLAFNLLEGDLIFETEEYNMGSAEYSTIIDDELIITMSSGNLLWLVDSFFNPQDNKTYSYTHISSNPNSVMAVFNIVPEPSSYALLLGSLALGLVALRRRL
tara:strand:+ start:115 stop:753 length:639 start_codon:yes stop_codon:yes gene_type:complete